ncbi:MAG TPA: SGNH/GDSL hydrolase family protein, partial [Vicinamibacteria bacterium]|nr:SGNH/GDSL hydrolase family protein [Vicinamibacteria bacterium]
RKKPGARVTYHRREYTVEVAINALGLRDPERGYQAPAGTLRVLALGDSFLEGYTVPLEQTVTQVLERELSAGGCPAQVINAGTQAYSTDQEYLFYRSEGVKYRPQVVAVFFYYNDVVYNDRQEYFQTPKPIFEMGGGALRLHRYPVKPWDPAQAATEPPAELAEDGGLGAQPRSGSEPARSGGSPHGPSAGIHSRRSPPEGSALLEWARDRLWYGAPRAYNALARLGLWRPMPRMPIRLELRVYERRREPIIEDAWAKTRAILRALAGEVRAAGGHLVLVGVPSRFEVDERSWRLTRTLYGMEEEAWDRGQVMARLREIGAAESIPFLDLTAPLRAAEAPAYFTYDGHWTAAGHATAARALRDTLRAQGWLAACAATARTTPARTSP